MDKLKIAHDYFMKHGNPRTIGTDVAEAWEYADRMIEQEQRREDKTRPEVLLDKEWQPDWSQAPVWAYYWAKDSNGLCHWYSGEVCINENEFHPSEFGQLWDDAPLFGYSGEWRESLRKRP